MRLRVDLGDYLEENPYGRNLPGGKLWKFMGTMAEQIERPEFALKVVELVLPSRPGGTQMRLFRMATRPKLVEGDRRELIDVLREDGAVIFADWMRDKKFSGSFFEVVSPDITEEIVRRVGIFSRDKLVGSTDEGLSRLENDIQAFWERGKMFGQGQVVPVHGLCLPWYDGI